MVMIVTGNNVHCYFHVKMNTLIKNFYHYVPNTTIILYAATPARQNEDVPILQILDSSFDEEVAKYF